MIRSGSADLIRWLENPIKREVPKGWMTSKQIVDKTGLGHATVRRKLLQGVKDGSVLREAFLIQCEDGRTRPVPHYFIKRK